MVLERFLRYVRFYTTSDESSTLSPARRVSASWARLWPTSWTRSGGRARSLTNTARSTRTCLPRPVARTHAPSA